LIQKEVREKTGTRITSASSVKDIWKRINDIVKPENLAKNSIKIQTEDKLIEDPLELAEKFNAFFKEEIVKLTEGIKKDPNSDPFSRLKEKLHGSSPILKLKTVNENEVLKLLKSLKPKKSYGCDGITSEILKIGAEVLVVPLTHIINFSIVTGKYPTKWNIAKVIPLHKKGTHTVMKNYRPIALLSVAGMILEKVIASQIEQYFEKNKLL
jgi:hypothetical protein